MKRICAVILFLVAFIVGGFAQVPAGKEAVAPKIANPDYSSEAIVCEEILHSVRFENDGTGIHHHYARFRVQSEAGVKQLGLLRIGYEKDEQELSINFVRVHKADGSVVNTPTENAQDMPADISRVAPMYSDLRERHVNVVNLRPGDTLEYDFVIRLKSPVAAGQFWFSDSIEANVIVLDSKIEVDVPAARPLKMRVDPLLQSKVREEKGRRIYTWSYATLEHKKKPEPKISDEEDEDTSVPSIELSSFQSWAELAKWIADLQRERIVPTETVRAKALSLTKGLHSDSAKAAAIYRFVSQEIRYVALEFGIGRFQPNAPDTVLANGYGDCKDKHALLASLFTAVGLHADPVLINTGRKMSSDVPSPAQFNHMISAVTVGKQHTFLDTTAEVAPYGFLISALRDRKALLVVNGAPEIVDVPADTPFPQSKSLDIVGKVDEKGHFDAQVKLTVRGDEELLYRLAFRGSEHEKWEELAQSIAFMSGFSGKVSELKLSDLEDTNTPLLLSYHYTRESYVTWHGNSGTMRLALPNMGLPDVKNTDEKPQPVKFRALLTFNYRARVTIPENTRAKPLPDLDLKKPYADYKAAYRMEGNDLVSERTLVTKTLAIKQAQREEYAEFRKQVSDDSDSDMDIARGKALADAPVVASKRDKKDVDAAEDLFREGSKALQSRDAYTAVSKFQQAIKLDPDHPYAWSELGRARLMQNDTEEAIRNCRKQLEVNPANQDANLIIALAQLSTSDIDASIKSLKKQIEIAPDDPRARSLLVQIFMERKDYKQALPHLETLAAMGGAARQVYQYLGQAYIANGETDKAIKVFDKLLESSESPDDRNNVAYVLADAGLELDRALKLSQQSVEELAAHLRKVSLDDVSREDMGDVSLMVASWDTVGWVHFKRGDSALARSYLEAAWNSAQDSEVAEHLAKLYEKLGEKALSAKFWAYSSYINESKPARVVRPAAPKRTTAPTPYRDHSKVIEEIQNMRTIKLARRMDTTATAEFFILLGPAGVVDTHFIKGSDALSSWGGELKKAKFNTTFPSDLDTRIVRRGILSCEKFSGCMLVLFEPGRANAE